MRAVRVDVAATLAERVNNLFVSFVPRPIRIAALGRRGGLLPRAACYLELSVCALLYHILCGNVPLHGREALVSVVASSAAC